MILPAPIYPDFLDVAPMLPALPGAWAQGSGLGGGCSDLCGSFLLHIFMGGLPRFLHPSGAVRCLQKSRHTSAAATSLPGHHCSYALVLILSVLFCHVYGISHGRRSDYTAWWATLVQ